MITIIAAMTASRVIGKDNKLPWNLKEDLQNFKRLTSGNTVIMGRKTFESIGRPLPNRNNIVVSQSMNPMQGIDVCRDVDEALQKAASYGKEIFIIGGAAIYAATLPYADRMILSHVKKEYAGDTYFPAFNEEGWNLKKLQEYAEFDVVEYRRKC